ncbi:acetyl-CoA carboxylase carboxyltransferase component [Ilumatobacter fluminis]|uniref:Acetyl-CoA carboxylase carboxyltransferase component n=1 Tax=Ilumatobacter fluminis TaxID=467091 RepID=A0A4R7HZT2_9ACTN|nr:carboxyl transferase domain-containing protein [Ilumatobacter fluminis]TDT16274.1 acetyl-CoA carboxylase carboxyltransferase component [Ilumatobacter fluminis]
MAQAVHSELQGTIVSILVGEGDVVGERTVVALVESMKLHHDVVAGVAGRVSSIAVAEGTTVQAGTPIVHVEPVGEDEAVAADEIVTAGPTGTDRRDLADVIARHELGLDEARPEAVAKRHGRGHRTARENLADLVDDGTFVEYGPLAVAAQRKRRTHDDLIANTPADGMIGGIGTINGALFEGRDARAVAVSYDYMVLAGTQGTRNHIKKDRLFEVAERLRLPVVFFTEGGGGRPGDTETPGVSGLDCLAFLWFGQLSGTVPLVGIASGYCFAGNAAILGCCDVVIATRDANIGMGGPAMIEGGGLGVYAPTEVGPIEVQRANGVVDVVADDEAHATAIAKQYLSYFQGPVADWTCPDQTALRDVVPTDRLRSYDVRAAIEALFDTDSVLELRRDFANGMITALARVEGRPVGVIANDPAHLAGAITSDGADKAARFMQLCDAHGIPIVSLVDTPGMMVGPETEETALVRHCSRLFVTGANVTVPMVSIVLRKSYGLGAQAMMGGSTKAPLACIAWPTGEFGGMGLEGAVRLGYRKELDACTTDADRDALFAELVGRLYEVGKALSVAEYFEIDDVIDPVDTRRWISAILESAPPRPDGPVRPNVDTW